MADPIVAPQSGTQTSDAKITSAGKPTPVTFAIPGAGGANGNGNAGAGAAAATSELSEEQKLAAAEAEKNKLPEVNDDQLKAILKERGIELDDKGFDGLKEKLKPPPPAKDPEAIAKEKADAETAFEKRMLDHYTAHGGKVEDYVATKTIAAMDLKALSEAEIRKELMEAGFDGDEIALVIKERYYQINPEELVRDEDNETEEQFQKRKAFTEKKIAFGSKKSESKSVYTKKQAESALSALREAIQTEDQLKADEVATEAKNSERVDDFFKKAQREVTIELGKTEDGKEDIAPVPFPVPEALITDVRDTLKDPQKRKQFLYNEDNSLNLDNVGAMMLENKYLKAALKDVYFAGGKRQVEAFEKIFPGRIAKDVGVGGQNGGGTGGRKGEVASAGKPQPAVRNTQ